jgi:hypothetical protein
MEGCQMTPVAARGAVRGNGVIYVLAFGIVLAIAAMFFFLKIV